MARAGHRENTDPRGDASREHGHAWTPSLTRTGNHTAPRGASHTRQEWRECGGRYFVNWAAKAGDTIAMMTDATITKTTKPNMGM